MQSRFFLDEDQGLEEVEDTLFLLDQCALGRPFSYTLNNPAIGRSRHQGRLKGRKLPHP